MAFVRDAALDALLADIRSNVDKLHITSAEASSFANVASVTLGNKATPSLGAVGAATPNGRKFTVSAITDGTVTGTGTAAYWALVDEGSSELLATGALSSSQGVTNGNTFTLAAFDITAPDAVAEA